MLSSIIAYDALKDTLAKCTGRVANNGRKLLESGAVGIPTTPRSVDSFLAFFKKKSKEEPAAVVLQSWWRMVTARRRYIRLLSKIKSARRKVLAPFFRRWRSTIRAAVHYRKTIMRRVLWAWRFDSAIHHGKQLRITHPQNPAEWHPITSLTALHQLGKGATDVSKRLCIFVFFKQIRLLRRAFNIWVNWTHTRKEKLKTLEALMKQAAEKIVRLKARLVLQMWHRYARFSRAIRDGKKPVLDYEAAGAGELYLWDRWLAFYERKVILKNLAYSLWKENNLSTTFRRWRAYVIARREKRENECKSTEFFMNTFVRRAFREWHEYCLNQRADRQYTRTIFKRWRAWAKKSHRSRRLIEAMVNRRSKRLLRTTYFAWRRYTHQSLFVTAAGIVAVRGNPARALHTVYALQHHETKRVFIQCWLRWTAHARRRLAWKRFLAAHWQQHRLALLATCFSVWRSYKRSTAGESNDDYVWQLPDTQLDIERADANKLVELVSQLRFGAAPEEAAVALLVNFEKEEYEEAVAGANKAQEEAAAKAAAAAVAEEEHKRNRRGRSREGRIRTDGRGASPSPPPPSSIVAMATITDELPPPPPDHPPHIRRLAYLNRVLSKWRHVRDKEFVKKLVVAYTTWRLQRLLVARADVRLGAQRRTREEEARLLLRSLGVLGRQRFRAFWKLLHRDMEAAAEMLAYRDRRDHYLLLVESVRDCALRLHEVKPEFTVDPVGKRSVHLRPFPRGLFRKRQLIIVPVAAEWRESSSSSSSESSSEETGDDVADGDNRQRRGRRKRERTRFGTFELRVLVDGGQRRFSEVMHDLARFGTEAAEGVAPTVPTIRDENLIQFVQESIGGAKALQELTDSESDSDEPSQGEEEEQKGSRDHTTPARKRRHSMPVRVKLPGWGEGLLDLDMFDQSFGLEGFTEQTPRARQELFEELAEEERQRRKEERRRQKEARRKQREERLQAQSSEGYAQSGTASPRVAGRGKNALHPPRSSLSFWMMNEEQRAAYLRRMYRRSQDIVAKDEPADGTAQKEFKDPEWWLEEIKTILEEEKAKEEEKLRKAIEIAEKVRRQRIAEIEEQIRLERERQRELERKKRREAEKRRRAKEERERKRIREMVQRERAQSREKSPPIATEGPVAARQSADGISASSLAALPVFDSDDSEEERVSQRRMRRRRQQLQESARRLEQMSRILTTIREEESTESSRSATPYVPHKPKSAFFLRYKQSLEQFERHRSEREKASEEEGFRTPDSLGEHAPPHSTAEPAGERAVPSGPATTDDDHQSPMPSITPSTVPASRPSTLAFPSRRTTAGIVTAGQRPKPEVPDEGSDQPSEPTVTQSTRQPPQMARRMQGPLVHLEQERELQTQQSPMAGVYIYSMAGIREENVFAGVQTDSWTSKSASIIPEFRADRSGIRRVLARAGSVPQLGIERTLGLPPLKLPPRPGSAGSPLGGRRSRMVVQNDRDGDTGLDHPPITKRAPSGDSLESEAAQAEVRQLETRERELVERRRYLMALYMSLAFAGVPPNSKTGLPDEVTRAYLGSASTDSIIDKEGDFLPAGLRPAEEYEEQQRVLLVELNKIRREHKEIRKKLAQFQHAASPNHATHFGGPLRGILEVGDSAMGPNLVFDGRGEALRVVCPPARKPPIHVKIRTAEELADLLPRHAVSLGEAEGVQGHQIAAVPNAGSLPSIAEPANTAGPSGANKAMKKTKDNKHKLPRIIDLRFRTPAEIAAERLSQKARSQQEGTRSTSPTRMRQIKELTISVEPGTTQPIEDEELHELLQRTTKPPANAFQVRRVSLKLRRQRNPQKEREYRGEEVATSTKDVQEPQQAAPAAVEQFTPSESITTILSKIRKGGGGDAVVKNEIGKEEAVDNSAVLRPPEDGEEEAEGTNLPQPDTTHTTTTSQQPSEAPKAEPALPEEPPKAPRSSSASRERTPGSTESKRRSAKRQPPRARRKRRPTTQEAEPEEPPKEADDDEEMVVEDFDVWIPSATLDRGLLEELIVPGPSQKRPPSVPLPPPRAAVSASTTRTQPSRPPSETAQHPSSSPSPSVESTPPIAEEEARENIPDVV